MSASPLDIGMSLKGIDTSFPSLGLGDHLVALRGYKVEESKKTPSLFMLVLTNETQEPADDANGKPLPPGFKFPSRITLPGQPGVDPDNEKIREKQLAGFIDICLGTDITNRPDFNRETMDLCIGKKYKVKMKANDDPAFGATQVGSYIAVPQD